MTTQQENRIKELKNSIQNQYDLSNWNSSVKYPNILTIAAQVELIQLGVTDFVPEYNCPA